MLVPPPQSHQSQRSLPTKILLKSTQNQYVRLNDKPPYYLITDAQIAQTDTFYFCDLGRNIVALKAKGQYVSVYQP